jgi:CRP/FNR family cyclic AMP-dependent transcriptional regulator
MLRGRAANVLLEDRGLRTSLQGERLDGAIARGRVATVVIARGAWSDVVWPAGIRQGAGLLVLCGMLLSRTEIEHRAGAELLGAGDLLRPWQDCEASYLGTSSWRVLARARIAVLDVDFMQRIASYHELQTQLIERPTARARHLAAATAIISHPRVDTRLRLMLWHLAERWGMDRPAGVLIPRLTHETLAELIAARRPTVSSALSCMRDHGEIETHDKAWLLRTPRCRKGTRTGHREQFG